MKTLKFTYGDSLGENQNSEMEMYENHVKNLGKSHRKQAWFYRWVQSHLPVDLWDRVTIRFTDIGWSTQILHIDVNDEDMDTTIEMIQWLSGLERWSFEKDFSESEGTFMYRAKRDAKFNEYVIRVGNVANVDDCKIVKRRRMRTVYESDCGK